MGCIQIAEFWDAFGYSLLFAFIAATPVYIGFVIGVCKTPRKYGD